MKITDTSRDSAEYTWRGIGCETDVENIDTILNDWEWFTCVDIAQIDEEIGLQAKIDAVTANKITAGMYSYEPEPTIPSINLLPMDRFFASLDFYKGMFAEPTGLPPDRPETQKIKVTGDKIPS